ncbi:MAG: hypothetical protein A2Z20_02635 [Bdellovibrionales bacterium RBG_16_40_8]|nr:MAG: hypothetical protein A2Z20_02635 [Bdellovibrionales bacterium RBG_16_40_8]
MTSGEDISANIKDVSNALESLRVEKCDLICLPENVFFLRIDKSSKTADAMNLKETFWQEFCNFANQEKCSILFGSVALKRDKKKSTSATILVSPQKRPKVVYEKIHLFDVDVKGAPPVRESLFFEYGKKPKLIKINDWNIGLSICYDVRFAELYQAYAAKNAHLILVPAAFLVPTGLAHWHVLLRARAIESQAFVVAAAQAGNHTNSQGATRQTFGHSLVVGPWGEIKLDMGNSGAKVTAITLDVAELQKTREQIPMAHHRRL